MIKGVIFDLDDTLYDYTSADKVAVSALCKYVCDTFKVTESVFHEVYSQGKKVTKEILPDCAAQHNRLLYCQKTCEFLGVNPLVYAMDMYEIYWSSFLKQIQLREGVLDFFKILKRKKIKTAICTDLTAHIQYRKIQKLGIEKFINYLVTSEEIGEEKPAKKMFLVCLDKMGLGWEETVFIGDDLQKDIKGAIVNGMKAIWYFNDIIHKGVEDTSVILQINKFTDERLLALWD